MLTADVVDAEKWDKALSVSVKGTMLCYKHAAIQMIKQGRGGRIVGAASTASKQGMSHGLLLACHGLTSHSHA